MPTSATPSAVAPPRAGAMRVRTTAAASDTSRVARGGVIGAKKSSRLGAAGTSGGGQHSGGGHTHASGPKRTRSLSADPPSCATNAEGGKEGTIGGGIGLNNARDISSMPDDAPPHHHRPSPALRPSSSTLSSSLLAAARGVGGHSSSAAAAVVALRRDEGRSLALAIGGGARPSVVPASSSAAVANKSSTSATTPNNTKVGLSAAAGDISSSRVKERQGTEDGFGGERSGGSSPAEVAAEADADKSSVAKTQKLDCTAAPSTLSPVTATATAAAKSAPPPPPPIIAKGHTHNPYATAVYSSTGQQPPPPPPQPRRADPRYDYEWRYAPHGNRAAAPWGGPLPPPPPSSSAYARGPWGDAPYAYGPPRRTFAPYPYPHPYPYGYGYGYGREDEDGHPYAAYAAYDGPPPHRSSSASANEEGYGGGYGERRIAAADIRSWYRTEQPQHAQPSPSPLVWHGPPPLLFARDTNANAKTAEAVAAAGTLETAAEGDGEEGGDESLGAPPSMDDADVDGTKNSGTEARAALADANGKGPTSAVRRGRRPRDTDWAPAESDEHHHHHFYGQAEGGEYDDPNILAHNSAFGHFTRGSGGGFPPPSAAGAPPPPPPQYEEDSSASYRSHGREWAAAARHYEDRIAALASRNAQLAADKRELLVALEAAKRSAAAMERLYGKKCGDVIRLEAQLQQYQQRSGGGGGRGVGRGFGGGGAPPAIPSQDDGDEAASEASPSLPNPRDDSPLPPNEVRPKREEEASAAPPTPLPSSGTATATAWEAVTSVVVHPTTHATRFYCEVCNVLVNSEVSLKAHLEGDKHRKGQYRLQFRGRAGAAAGSPSVSAPRPASPKPQQANGGAEEEASAAASVVNNGGTAGQQPENASSPSEDRAGEGCE